MTAQVAVLSTQGIAVASDSAVTIVDRDRGNRSYPSADKIFSLPGVPVAVLHSGNAQLRGVPWQILIERWAIDRGPVELESMSAYAAAFFAWLVKQDHYSDREAQDGVFRWMFRDYMLGVRTGVRKALEREGVTLEPGYLTSPGEVGLVNEVIDHFLEQLANRPDIEGLDAETASGVVQHLRNELREDLEWVFDDTPSTVRLDQAWLTIAEHVVMKAEPFSIDATLAFVGYGAGAFFPSSWQGTITGIVGDVARVWDVRETQIGPSMGVAINPYGLTDAIHMFLRGTSWSYRSAAHHALDALTDELGDQDDHAEVLSRAHEQLVDRFDALEWNDFLKPMLDIAEKLPLAELVRLADSLVELASLRQMISGDTSVGGPVDLARITKNGGFEWVRRKSEF